MLTPVIIKTRNTLTGGIILKRSCLLVAVILFLVSSVGQASSWGWWAPSIPSTQNPGWNTPIWPTTPTLPTQPTQPQQPTQPKPNPGAPLQPVQPSNPGNKVPLPNASLSADEQSLINQVNQERLKNGLKALQVDYALVALAKEKSYDMAVNNYFDHVSPTLGTVYTMLDKAGISYSRAGENIARTGSISRAHPLFMNSPGHRANILHSGYTHIGVGIVKQGTSYHITQIFIKK